MPYILSTAQAIPPKRACQYETPHIGVSASIECHKIMTMEYREFLREIRKAHLTLAGFARLVGMNRVSLSNYAKRGRVPSHLAIIARLLGEMGKRNIEFQSLLQSIEIEPKKPRGAGIGKFGGDRQSRLF